MAGVSIFTASRALGSGEGVARETREHVLKVSGQLGYVPNRMARNLRTARSTIVGVLTTNAHNQFYNDVAAAFQRHMQKSGYTSFVTDAYQAGRYAVENEDAFIASMLEQRAAGVVLTHEPTRENLEKLRAFRVPLVFLDCVPGEAHSNLPSVTTDGRSACRDAGRVFARNGRRDWLLVGHSAGWNTRLERERGFREAARETGAGLDVVEGGNDAPTAERAVTEWLDNGGKADAILCTNEPLLYGTMKVLAQKNITVPDSVALIGFDDFDWATLMRPKITVIEQPRQQLGIRVAELMLRQFDLEKDDGPLPEAAPREALPAKLIIRESCGSRT